MPPIHAVPVGNRLLSALPRPDCEPLLEHSEVVELAISEVLYQAGERVAHLYFPTGSLVSLVAPIDGDAGLEVGLVGNEGMVGITLMLGVDIAPFKALVQGAGPALRLPAAKFLSLLERSPALQCEMNRYLYVSVNQLAQTAACNRFHLVEARLARWLLMTQDRAHNDSFHVTHVFLAYMLGVRRVGVTKAATSLQLQKLIRYHRGDITILDRPGLEAAACGCYQAGKTAYERFLG
jgi:CRP-like cAMP-binding protein